MNRRLLLVLLAALLLRMASLPMNEFERVALPGLAGVVALVVAALHSRRVPVRTLHLTTLLGCWVYLLSHLWFVLFRVPEPLQLATLAGVGPWVPVLLAAHLWMLGRQGSLPLNVVGLGASAALLSVFVAGPAGALASPVTGALTQMLLASLVLLGGQHSAVVRTLGLMRRDLLGDGLPDGRDALTGLPDRFSVQDALAREFRRRPEGLGVAVIELDQLPALQAQRGQGFTERLIAHVARVTLGALRDEDLLGRLNPDQLVVVLRAPDARAARAACERLRVRVASRPLEGVNPTVSIGLAFQDLHGDATELLRDAQDTLRGLEDGRNRVVVGGVGALDGAGQPLLA
ncbi:GGDEF domain-containing protein [Deinococcus depolymerans]|uniref:GGDEF domain-containing protein n=1 Tax=Deinococcus depolymerans TaxID=392408 RepID=UPI00309802F7